MIVCALEGGIQASCKHVLLDLPIPLVGYKLLEPLGKPGKFGCGEAGNVLLKVFDAHDRTVAEPMPPSKERRCFAEREVPPNALKLNDGGRKDEPKRTDKPPPFAGARG